MAKSCGKMGGGGGNKKGGSGKTGLPVGVATPKKKAKKK
jgi:hypothetical protein